MIFCFSFSFLIKPDPLIFQPPDSCTSSFSCCMFHFLTLMLVSFKTFTVQLFILYIFFLFPVYIYFSLSTLTSFFLSRILLFHLPLFLLFWILFFTFFSPFCLLPSFSVSLLLLSARKQDAAEQIPAEFLLLRYTHILTHYLSICLLILHWIPLHNWTLFFIYDCEYLCSVQRASSSHNFYR